MPKILQKLNFINKKSFFISIIIFFAILCIVIANYLTSLLLASNTTETVSSTSFEIHFLSLSKSQVEKEANTLAQDYQKINAGGFVWNYENYFYVISSAYSNKNDAVLVQNSIKANLGLESEILSIKFPTITINGSFSNDEKKVLNKSLSALYDYYLNLYDISISLDTAIYNNTSAKLAINNAHNSLATTKDNFNTLFENLKVSQLEMLSTLLSSAISISKELCQESYINQNQTYSSLIKYTYLKILNLYYDFLNK